MIAVERLIRNALKFIVSSGVADSALEKGADAARDARGRALALVEALAQIHVWRCAVDVATPRDFRAFAIQYVNEALRRALASHPVSAPDIVNNLVGLLDLFAFSKPETWTRALLDFEAFPTSPLGQRFLPLGRLLANHAGDVFRYIKDDVLRDMEEAQAWAAQTKGAAS